MALTRDEILSASDIMTEKVNAWGGEIYVKGMTGRERDKFEASILTIRGKRQDVNLTNVRAKLCVLTICDQDGKRLFDDTPADLELLSGKSAIELSKIFAVAQRLSGISADDVDEMTEALEDDPFAGSASDLQDT